ncbi:MAG: PQQ-dependent sugar dehydrogenase, partial [Microbacterium sp.]|nr:PQQ-dependent sugar dehydrogenase [Microbacterium sp.]
MADTGRGGSIAALVLAVSVAATGCTASPSPLRSSALPTAPTSAPSAEGGHWSVAGEPEVLARGLVAPWSVIPLAAGGALISQRDDGTIRELTARGALRDVGVVPDVVSGGEAGLNGIALQAVGDTTWLYAYHATRTDNRVVRMPLDGSPGSYRLGPAESVFTGIATAGN